MKIEKETYVNRELSWLSFNERVLQEASDPTTPLIERIKFLGIFSSNLDEFFRVRVATLTRMMNARKKAKAILGEDPKAVFNQIQKVVIHQQKRFDETYKDILNDLESMGIIINNEKQLTPEMEERVRSYFDNDVRPALFPVMIDSLEDFPMLKDQSIYLAVRMSNNGDPASYKHALIEVPTESVSRFFVLTDTFGAIHIMLLDDVIRYGLKNVFSMFGCTHFDAYTIKVNRDAELDIEEDSTRSFFEQISKSLKQRYRGAPVRFIFDSTMPDDFLKLLTKKSNMASTDTLIPGGRYHNFRDFMNFPSVGSKKLKYEPMPPLPHPDMIFAKSLFDAIARKDILIHYPYHSFHHMIDLLREASIDPLVTEIKITLYRVAKYSLVVNALINAARNGKSVTVVLELKARFDEEANIYWTTKLRDEGVKIIHGVTDLKVHCKLCIITRKEKKGLVDYASIGTGNFNENTARVYSDHSLLTTDTRITGEVEKIFDFFNRNYQMSRFAHLLVAPFFLRKKLNKLIDTEIEHARNGKEAYIILKLNSLYDKELIDRLYEASSAGVKIRMIVRGICSLVPGIEGLSENIEVISIVDRFLEHSRIYIFCNGGEEKYYIASADWMTRNLDRRVEVACPIYDKKLQADLKDFIDIQFSGNTKVRIINKEQNNIYRARAKGEKKIHAQYDIYKHMKRKAKSKLQALEEK